MSRLADATSALEIADAQLVAIQSRLARFSGWEGDPETGREIIDKIVDQIDFTIVEVRSALIDITKHDCEKK